MKSVFVVVLVVTILCKCSDSKFKSKGFAATTHTTIQLPIGKQTLCKQL